MNEEKLFTKDYILIALLGLLIRFSMFIKMTIQPLYLIDLFSSKTIAGLAMTVFTVAALVLRPLSGRIIDRYGRRRMFFWATLVFTLTTLPLGFINNLFVIYVLQAIGGIAFSIQSVADTTMVTDVVPEKKLTQGLGYYGLTATLAQAFGPAVGLLCVSSFSYSISFLITGAVNLLSIFVVLFIVYEKQPGYSRTVPEKEPGNNDGKGRLLDNIITRSAAYPSMYIGILSFIGASISTFLVPYAQLAGFPSIGLYFTFRAIGVAVSRILVSRVTQILGNFRTMIFSMILFALGTVGINFMGSIPAVIIVALLYGIGHGMASVVLNVGAVINTPQNNRAGANATFYLMIDAGIGIGSVTWGVVGDTLGMSNIFIGSAILSGFVFLAFSLIKKSRQIFS